MLDFVVRVGCDMSAPEIVVREPRCLFELEVEVEVDSGVEEEARDDCLRVKAMANSAAHDPP